MNEHMMPIPSRIYNAAVGGHVAGADQIIDDKTGFTLDKVAGGALEEKTYTLGSDNGMGRVVLRKNLVEGVNTLTQNMINKNNTIYIIQYDFILDEDITIPDNCVLKFDGGSISGEHIINTNNTVILDKADNSILCNIAGSINGDVCLDWFITSNDWNTQDVVRLSYALTNLTNSNYYFSKDTYTTSNKITITNKNKIILNGNNCVILGQQGVYTGDSFFINAYVNSLEIFNFTLKYFVVGIQIPYNIDINNIEIYNIETYNVEEVIRVNNNINFSSDLQIKIHDCKFKELENGIVVEPNNVSYLCIENIKIDNIRLNSAITYNIRQSHGINKYYWLSGIHVLCHNSNVLIKNTSYIRNVNIENIQVQRASEITNYSSSTSYDCYGIAVKFNTLDGNYCNIIDCNVSNIILYDDSTYTAKIGIYAASYISHIINCKCVNAGISEAVISVKRNHQAVIKNCIIHNTITGITIPSHNGVEGIMCGNCLIDSCDISGTYYLCLSDGGSVTINNTKATNIQNIQGCYNAASGAHIGDLYVNNSNIYTTSLINGNNNDLNNRDIIITNSIIDFVGLGGNIVAISNFIIKNSRILITRTHEYPTRLQTTSPIENLVLENNIIRDTTENISQSMINQNCNARHVYLINNNLYGPIIYFQEQWREINSNVVIILVKDNFLENSCFTIDTNIADYTTKLALENNYGYNAVPATIIGTSTLRTKNHTKGTYYFDTTLGKPIWWNGTGWVDATGTPV